MDLTMMSRDELLEQYFQANEDYGKVVQAKIPLWDLRESPEYKIAKKRLNEVLEEVRRRRELKGNP